MYNRYLEPAHDYMQVDSREAAEDCAENEGRERSPLLKLFSGSEKREGSILDLGKSLFKNFKFPHLELDDLILLGLIFLILRENGEEEIILIIAALYLFGLV